MALGPIRLISPDLVPRVTAVDLSDESLKMAKQRAKVFGLEDKIFVLSGQRRRTQFPLCRLSHTI